MKNSSLTVLLTLLLAQPLPILAQDAVEFPMIDRSVPETETALFALG